MHLDCILSHRDKKFGSSFWKSILYEMASSVRDRIFNLEQLDYYLWKFYRRCMRAAINFARKPNRKIKARFKA